MPSVGQGIAFHESNADREAHHHFTFGADVVLFTCVIAYVGKRAFAPKEAPLTWSDRWVAFSLVCIGCAFLILDPIRHVLLDHSDILPINEQDFAMYVSATRPPILSPRSVGQLASVFGMVLLVCGVLWHMKLPQAVFAKITGDTSKCCSGSSRSQDLSS